MLAVGNDGGALAIENIEDPTNPQDVATKAYVDAAINPAEVETFGVVGPTALNFASSRFQAWTLAGNATIPNLTFVNGAGYYTLRVTQPAAYSLAWPLSVDFGIGAPDPVITSPGTYIFSIFWNGSKAYAQVSPTFDL